MLSHELRAREAKLLKEQQQRVERERQRAEKERMLQERQRRREAEREEEKTRKRLELLEAERRAQERIEQLTEHNRGVYFSGMLQGVPQDEAAVAARGIKRANDKVSLPPSVGAQLMHMDAPRNGAPVFEISTPGGSVTHAGVLDFSSPEGVVALPKKVADCLWGRGVEVNGPVTVTYKRLEKGTFVRFQPLNRGFHDAVSEHMREVLERALMQCTVLTEGDIIRVDCSPVLNAAAGPSTRGAGQEEDISIEEAAATPVFFDLLVQELQPDTAVSLIDTDMEAQVVPSLETEQALQRLEEQRQASEAARRERERLALEALRLAQEEDSRRRATAEQARADEAAARERRRAALEATLPPEPELPPAPSAAPLGEAGVGTAAAGTEAAAGPSSSATPPAVMTAMFRMPDGSRVSRRFLLDSPVALLFHFCDAKGAGGMAPGSYRLVMQFPRRVLEPGSAGSLAEAGLAAGQHEAMMLEALTPVGEKDEGHAVAAGGSGDGTRQG